MPIIKSAKKRVKVAKKAAVRNSKTKRSLKSAVKAFRSALSGGGKKAAQAQSKAQSELDKAAKKGVIHKNKAARRMRQLAKASKTAATAKPAAKKATKTAAKK
jgi:small subunit ribosomal protein S20